MKPGMRKTDFLLCIKNGTTLNLYLKLFVFNKPLKKYSYLIYDVAKYPLWELEMIFFIPI